MSPFRKVQLHYQHNDQWFERIIDVDEDLTTTLDDILASIPDKDQPFKKWRTKMLKGLHASRSRPSPDHKNRQVLTVDGEVYAVVPSECVPSRFWDANTYRSTEEDNETLVFDINFDTNSIQMNYLPVAKLQPDMPSAAHLIPFTVRVKREPSDHFCPIPADFPANYRFDVARDVPAPPVKRGVLTAYNALQADVLSSHSVLGLPEGLSPCDQVSIKVKEIYVGAYVHERGSLLYYSMGSYIYESPFTWNRALGALISFLVLPVHIFSSTRFPAWSDFDSGFWWPREHICVSYASSLYPKDNREGAVLALVKHIKSRPNRPFVVYGVACSFWHCVIVRVDNASTPSVSHTDALELLPAFHATSPSTPGISALARLGNISALDDPPFFYRALNYLRGAAPCCIRHLRMRKPTPQHQPVQAYLLRLPLELITEIASYLDHRQDLNSLAVVCKKITSACIPRLRFPQLNNTDPCCPNDHGYILKSCASWKTKTVMTSGWFTTIQDGKKVAVKLSLEKADEHRDDYKYERPKKGYAKAVAGKFYLPPLEPPEDKKMMAGCVMPKMLFY